MFRRRTIATRDDGGWDDTGPTSDAVVAWNRRILPALLIAALAPLITDYAVEDLPLGVVLAVDLAAWLVFLVDLLIRRRLMPGFLRTPWGLFILGIVVITFPAYLLFGSYGRLVVLARMSLVVRLVVLAAHMPALRRLLARLNKLVLFTAGVMVLCSWIAYRSDGPGDNFDNFGDALWWGIVTMTTTGYGDIVPNTTEGRLAGSVLMLAGLILLGTLAASVASYFTAGDQALNAPANPTTPGGPAANTPGTALPVAGPTATQPDSATELAALRNELAELRSILTGNDGAPSVSANPDGHTRAPNGPPG